MINKHRNALLRSIRWVPVAAAAALFAAPQPGWPQTGNPSSNSQADSAASPLRINVLRLLWKAPLFGPLSAHPELPHFSHLPGSNVILVQDSSGLRALDLTTGKSAWPYDDHEPGYLVRSADSGPTVSSPPMWGGALLGQCWYGIVGQQFLVVDLAAEGRLQWGKTSEQLLGTPARDTSLVAAQIQADGLIIVSVQIRQPDREPIRQLTGLNLQGAVLWKSEPVSITASHSPLPADSVAGTGSMLAWNVAGQRVVILNPADGTLLRTWDLPETPILQDVADSPTRLFIAGDQLIVSGGHRLWSFRPADGSIRWELELGFPIHNLIAVAAGTLLATGDQLAAIDLASGTLRWQGGASNSSDTQTGSVLLAGRSLFWATRGELWTINPESGVVLQRDDLQNLTGDGAGNLQLIGNSLLIATGNQVTALRVERVAGP